MTTATLCDWEEMAFVFGYKRTKLTADSGKASMLAVEELLQPISSTSETGQNLRYDPVFDRIREALSEDDGSLPMGNWVRQVKHADYPLAVSLAQDTLQKRSKDLWLAGWLGEATIQVEGSKALDPALRLIAGLQERFWLSLYPEIEEDDLSMRAAPVQWSLDRFATLLEKFPITEDGLPFSAYKTVRARMAWSESENSSTAESLDESLRATPIKFYVHINSNLTQALKTLEELQTFCNDRYGDDGPSFPVLRGALEELRGLVAQQLRLRPLLTEDIPEPAREKSDSETTPAGAGTMPRPVEDASHVSNFVRQAPVAVATPAQFAFRETDNVAYATPQSWEEAISRVESCAAYLIDQRPEHPACYLLAIALQRGRDGARTPDFPLPEVRIALKHTFDSKNWSALLMRAVRAISEGGTRQWLDPHRYAWQAAANLGATRLQKTITALVRAQMAENRTWPEESFSDDTPVANAETKRWLEDELALRVEEPVVDSASVLPSLKPVKEANDAFASAAELVERGETEQALERLIDAAASAQNGRDRFLVRIEICDVCLKADKRVLAANILRHVLSETGELCLERWEGRILSGRLLGMMLDATDQDDANAEERRKIYARLCVIDPAQALARSAAG